MGRMSVAPRSRLGMRASSWSASSNIGECESSGPLIRLRSKEVCAILVRQISIFNSLRPTPKTSPFSEAYIMDSNGRGPVRVSSDTRGGR